MGRRVPDGRADDRVQAIVETTAIPGGWRFQDTLSVIGGCWP